MLKVFDVLVLELVEVLKVVALLVVFFLARTSAPTTVAFLLDNPAEALVVLEVEQVFGTLRYLVVFAPVRVATTEVVTVCLVAVFVVVTVTAGVVYDGSTVVKDIILVKSPVS